MVRFVFAALLALDVCTSAFAQPAFDPARRAEAVAPLVDAQTIAVLHVDLERFRAADIATRLASTARLPEADGAKMIDRAKSLQDAIVKTGAKEIFILASFADIQSPFIVFTPLAESGDAKKLFELLDPLWLAFSSSDSKRSYAHKDGRFLAGSEKALVHLNGLKPEARPEIKEAFAAAGDTALQVLVVPSADHRRVVEELLRELPKELGSLSGKKLSAGVRWAAIGFDSGPKLTFNAVVQSQDAAAAKVMRDFAIDLLQQLGRVRGPDDKPILETFGRDFQKVAEALTPQVADDRLVLRAGEEKILDVLAKIYTIRTFAASQEGRMNDLKQLGIAIHNYADTYGNFPRRAGSGEPNARPQNQKPHLSWRVYLLPYIEQDALFKQFHLDEPWDSDHNRKLIDKMPRTFARGDAKLAAAGKTRFVAPSIKNAIFEPEGPPIKFSDVFDGTSNTVMVLEAAEESAVIWTKPDDLSVDEKNPAKGVFNANDGNALMLFADGSVRRVKKALDPKMLLYLFLRNDGNPVSVP